MIKSRRATTPEDKGKSCDNCRFMMRGEWYDTCRIDGAICRHQDAPALKTIICKKYKYKEREAKA